MKRAVSIILSLLFLAITLMTVPVCVGAVTNNQTDVDNYGAVFDFEDKDYMYVTSQSQSSSKCEWQVDALNKIEYYVAGWGFSKIVDNPVTNDTGVEQSVVNSSAKVMSAYKTKYNTYSTSGGIVMNRKTDKGIEAIVLEDNTTYTVEFDYNVNQTHIYGDYVNPSDSSQTGTIKDNTNSYISFGYGYRTKESSNLAPVNEPITTVAKIASYTPNKNEDGTFTDAEGKTRQVGSWYHQSHTFTTGTFDSVFSAGSSPTTANAPFLIFYARLYTEDWFVIDNITIKKHVDINLNANGGSVSESTYSGVIGGELSLPTPSRMGYEFTGWYKDGACTVPFTDLYLTKENAGTTIYAGWKLGVEGFENYTFSGNDVDNFTISEEQAYIGSKSMKYSWTKKSSSSADASSGRTNENHYFGIQTLSQSGTYKIAFKYYISGSANITAYPVLVGESNSATVTKPNGQNTITLNGSSAGRWQTMSLAFTVSSISGSANILALHMHVATNATITVYVDEVSVVPVKSDVQTGTLTVNDKSVELVNGDIIDNGFAYNNGYAVEGWYSDSALKNKITADVYIKDEISNAYPKFNEKVDLTANGITSNGLSYKHSGDFAEADYNNILVYSGVTGSGKAKLVNANAGAYMVEFLYKNSGDSDVTVTIGSASCTLKSGKVDKWRKGYIPVNITSQAELELFASGKSEIEIKDVYVKNINNKVYVLFDSTEFDGELTAVYGEVNSDLTFAECPIIDGKQFGGWYNGSTKFTATKFPSSSVTLIAKMQESQEKVSGDSNGDGVCNTVDLAKMKLYLVKIDTKIAEGADINEDGNINAVDLVLLYNILVGN